MAINRLPMAALEFERLVAPARAAAAAAMARGEPWLPHGLRPAGEDEPHPYHPTVQPPGTTRLESAQIPRLVARYTAHALSCDDDMRPTYFAAPHPDALEDDGHDDEAHRSLLLEARRQLRRARAAEDFSDVRESVEEHLTWEHAWLPAASDEFAALLKAMAEAQLAVVEEELRRLDGDIDETPALVALVDENDTWSAAIQTWVEEAAPNPRLPTRSERRRHDSNGWSAPFRCPP